MASTGAAKANVVTATARIARRLAAALRRCQFVGPSILLTASGDPNLLARQICASIREKAANHSHEDNSTCVDPTQR
jgi:hypothetical protein